MNIAQLPDLLQSSTSPLATRQESFRVHNWEKQIAIRTRNFCNFRNFPQNDRKFPQKGCKFQNLVQTNRKIAACCRTLAIYGLDMSFGGYVDGFLINSNHFKPVQTTPKRVRIHLVYADSRFNQQDLSRLELPRPAMACKPSASCKSLQYGTGLLDRNATGPPGVSNLADMIKVFWLQQASVRYGWIWNIW